jgi:hypothetical protein
MSSKFYNSEYLKNELLLIMSDEADVVEFANLLDKVRHLADHSIDRRQIELSDLIFWKSQINNMKKRVEIEMKKIEAIKYQEIYNRLKLINKPTDSMIKAEIESADLGDKYNKFREIYLTCDKWDNILTDLHFLSGQTHKVLGNG